MDVRVYVFDNLVPRLLPSFLSPFYEQYATNKLGKSLGMRLRFDFELA